MHLIFYILNLYPKSLLNLLNSNNLSVCSLGYLLHLCITMSSEDNSYFFLPDPDFPLLTALTRTSAQSSTKQ